MNRCMSALTETDLGSVALEGLAFFGKNTAHGPEIAPAMPGSSGITTDQLGLERQLRSALLPQPVLGK